MILLRRMFFVLSACLLAGIPTQNLHAKIADTLPIAKKGVLDLRKTDLSIQHFSLKGEWAIYWHQLLAPGDTLTKPTAFVPFPELWQHTIIGGKPLPSIGYASYRLTILLPPHAHDLALYLPDAYTSYRLYINGDLFAHSGSPDSIAARAIPKWIIQTREITSPADTLHLLLQVANFWHSKGGPYKEIQIGNRDYIFHEHNSNNALDLLLTGCLFMGGLFFFGLFLFGRHDKSILYFGLFCMSYSYRIFGARGYVLHSLVPDIPWTITTHLEYFSLFISVAFFILYTRHLYPKDSNKIIMQIQVWCCLVLSAIVVLFPPAVFTRLINPFLIVMFLVIGYAFYIYVTAMRHKRIGAQYALMSTAVVLIVFLLINLQYFGIVAPDKWLLFIGYTAFFFLQSLILSYRFASALKKAKEQAEQGLRAKNEFLSTMSHEIRTPLNSILGITHLILRDKPRPDQKEQLNVLLFSANNLLAIVNDILDYNKIEAGKVSFEMIETDLVTLMRNIISGYKSAAEEKGIDLRLEIDPDFHGRIIADPTRISQVLTNLVSNAIKFTRHGHVLVELKLVAQTEASVTITIRVEDTGIGIAPGKQKLIFEQFTQADASTSRKFGGTGLGLAICKKLLELQGSSLQLESEVGKGSVFYFTQSFPKISMQEITKEEQQAEEIAEETKPLTGMSILLVEDNEVNILVARTFLERWGASIDIAMNGQEALDKLDINRHKLILMDMHMPVMDGYEATRILRTRGVTIPIIALTASLANEVSGRMRDIGINEIIVKPFIPDDLLRIILHHTKHSA